MYGHGPGDRAPARSDAFLGNVKIWVKSVIELADPFAPRMQPATYTPTYDPNLWTIPVEFRGSMVMFLIILCIAKLRPAYRRAVLGTASLWALYCGYGHLFLFITGVFLCELHHGRPESTQPAIALEASPVLPSHRPDATIRHRIMCKYPSSKEEIVHLLIFLD